jgi:L-rhamnose mutarotase
MQRIALLFRIKSGTAAEYRDRHDRIWPEMTKLLTDAGVKNYSIWRFEHTLFAYFETENYKETSKILSQSDIYTKWRKYMEDIIEVDKNTMIKERSLEMMFLHE